MTRTQKQILPALHDSARITNPDLQEIGEKNYTATILKYSSLALPFPQLETQAKTVVAAINELHNSPGGTTVIPNPPINAELLTTSGESILTVDNEPLLSIQGGGGVAIPLYTLQIDDKIYLITGGGTAISTIQVTLYPSAWESEESEYYQSVSVLGITENSNIIVAPNPNSYDDYCNSGIIAISQAINTVVFRGKTLPEQNIQVNISYWN